jgi:hypothetical protein
LFSKPTKAESIYCTIVISNIDVIVAELLLEQIMEEEENNINYEAKALSKIQHNNADIECSYVRL